MNWDRAVHHLETLARSCADLADSPMFALRVEALWAVGAVLDEPADLERVTVAITVDLPVEQVPWRDEPVGAQHWANATKMARNPITAFWRSAHAPVWNHVVDRPALLWDRADGVREETIAALRDGRGVDVREAGPAEEDLRARLADELAISLAALRERTATYRERRWSPGKLDPLADGLFRVGEGYLDLLDVTGR